MTARPSEATRPRISVVIPARNEGAYLPRLLESIRRARDSYSGDRTVEVIVADNASTDRTRRIAEDYGCRVVPVERRIIGAVRNEGARAARGDFLAFVDADARVHPRTFRTIDRLLSREDIMGGATGIDFERSSPGLRATRALLVVASLLVRGPRTVRPLSVDTGVIFCRRPDFFEVGGYPEDRLYAEDVRFLRALSKLGRSRGQRWVSGTDARMVFSTRKFDEYGDWHYFRLLSRLAWHLVTGRDALARSYWYDVRDDDRDEEGT